MESLLGIIYMTKRNAEATGSDDETSDPAFRSMVEQENARIAAAWAGAGLSVPLPELSGERLDNFLARLSEIEKRWHSL